MINIIKEIAFWLVVGIGLCGLVIGFLWLLNRAVTWVTKSFQIYTDFVQFMWQKRRKSG